MKIATLVMCMVVGLAGCSKRASNIQSVEDAKEFLVGTWVYSQPITDERPGLLSWMRWEIQSDGTLIQQTASPRDNQWGKKEVVSYKTITDKFADTGDRYYGLDVNNTALRGIITKDGELYVAISGSEYAGLFKRGDKDLSN